LGAGALLLSASSNAQSLKPSRNEQIKAGQEFAVQIRKEQQILPATDLRVKLLREVGEKILAATATKGDPFNFTFDVVESKEINAFAVPGGPVFFYTGLIDQLKTVDELAGVMAHEITHIKREHWARSVEDSQKRNLFLIAIGLIARPSNDVMRGASLVNSVYGLKYSRGHETQSDDDGVIGMVKAGYNPEGMALVFETFRRLKKEAPVELLSTHPDDKNRINRIRAKAKAYKRNFPALTPLPFKTQAMLEEKQNTQRRLVNRKLKSKIIH